MYIVHSGVAVGRPKSNHSELPMGSLPCTRCDLTFPASSGGVYLCVCVGGGGGGRGGRFSSQLMSRFEGRSSLHVMSANGTKGSVFGPDNFLV